MNAFVMEVLNGAEEEKIRAANAREERAVNHNAYVNSQIDNCLVQFFADFPYKDMIVLREEETKSDVSGDGFIYHVQFFIDWTSEELAPLRFDFKAERDARAVDKLPSVYMSVFVSDGLSFFKIGNLRHAIVRAREIWPVYKKWDQQQKDKKLAQEIASALFLIEQAKDDETAKMGFEKAAPLSPERAQETLAAYYARKTRALEAQQEAERLRVEDEALLLDYKERLGIFASKYLAAMIPIRQDFFKLKKRLGEEKFVMYELRQAVLVSHQDRVPTIGEISHWTVSEEPGENGFWQLLEGETLVRRRFLAGTTLSISEPITHLPTNDFGVRCSLWTDQLLGMEDVVYYSPFNLDAPNEVRNIVARISKVDTTMPEFERCNLSTTKLAAIKASEETKQMIYRRLCDVGVE